MSPRARLLCLLCAALFAGPGLAQPATARPVLFCFWNVENLFDDKPNPNLRGVDKEFDDWFATNRQALDAKLERVAEVLLGKEMNAGRGPDVIALAEVESQRAVELVRDALNRRLPDKTAHYKAVVYRDPQGLRSIATAVISRLPVADARTRLLGRSQRMLKVHLQQGKHELVVIASHWTSRVSDAAGRGRSNY